MENLFESRIGRFFVSLSLFTFLIWAVAQICYIPSAEAKGEGVATTSLGKVTVAVTYRVDSYGAVYGLSCSTNVEPGEEEITLVREVIQGGKVMEALTRSLNTFSSITLFLSDGGGAVNFTAGIVKSKLSLLETTPQGVHMSPATVKTPRAKELKGSKYVGEPRLVALDQNWLLIVAATTTGMDARCVQLPWGRFSPPSKSPF